MKILRVFSVISVLVICFYNSISPIYIFRSKQISESNLLPITKSKERKADGPGILMRYQMEIRTKYGHLKPDYQPNYKFRELDKALKLKSRNSAALRQTGSILNPIWKERGPSNVPGRVRGLLVDPGDPNKNT